MPCAGNNKFVVITNGRHLGRMFVTCKTNFMCCISLWTSLIENWLPKNLKNWVFSQFICHQKFTKLIDQFFKGGGLASQRKNFLIKQNILRFLFPPRSGTEPNLGSIPTAVLCHQKISILCIQCKIYIRYMIYYHILDIFIMFTYLFIVICKYQHFHQIPKGKYWNKYINHWSC